MGKYVRSLELELELEHPTGGQVLGLPTFAAVEEKAPVYVKVNDSTSSKDSPDGDGSKVTHFLYRTAAMKWVVTDQVFHIAQSLGYLSNKSNAFPWQGSWKVADENLAWQPDAAIRCTPVSTKIVGDRGRHAR